MLPYEIVSLDINCIGTAFLIFSYVNKNCYEIIFSNTSCASHPKIMKEISNSQHL